MNNLQDVMEEDLYSNPSGFSGNNSMPNGLNNTLMSKPSLFASYNSFHRGMGLNPNSGFVLTSYDDDYNHSCLSSHPGSCIDNSLTPQASRNSFTPLQSMYVDSSNMVNDFVSESGYSPRPRLTPLATSPHYNDNDLSPRRGFGQSTSQSRLLGSFHSSVNIMCSNEEPRLQRSLSAIASSSLSAPVEMTYSANSFKRKDS